jgi:hypothetical protein
MTEYVPSPGDDELEAIIQRLVYRLDDAREGSAEHKMIIRQLVGVRDSSELAGLIIEEFEMRVEVSLPRRTDRR